MKVNRNIIWTETFFDELADNGVKYVCLAPGSRSTPLAFAVASNKRLKSYIFIDERSCAFFALGLAKSSNTPVALVCTSGTAVAEFFPAVIEAYQQNVPLIICTADRPPELIGNGANQTIIQNGIYKNYVLWSFDLGLPELLPERLKHVRLTGRRAFFECNIKNCGPIHLNFPFRKPFEPENYTDDVNKEIIAYSSDLKQNSQVITPKISNANNSGPDLQVIISELRRNRKGIIIAGPDSYQNDYSEECINLAKMLHFPIIADGTSQFRFGKLNYENILVNYEAFLRTNYFVNNLQPETEIILQFGRTVTSGRLEAFLESTTAKRFIINEFGNWYDPYNNAEAVVKADPGYFCNSILRELEGNYNPDDNWLENFISAETITKNLKDEFLSKAPFPFEGKIINEIINLLPNDSALMISNSMPVRDLDYFSPKTVNKIAVFSNRGVSGIDGITSTAMGISAGFIKPTFLITGDLAFLHDINGLFPAFKYSIPLVIILINNNGGGIFEMLPVSGYENIFKDYFLTPHNLDFANFVKGFSGEFFNISGWDNLKSTINSVIKTKGLKVLEIKTDSKESVGIRKQFWFKVKKGIEEHFIAR